MTQFTSRYPNGSASSPAGSQSNTADSPYLRVRGETRETASSYEGPSLGAGARRSEEVSESPLSSFSPRFSPAQQPLHTSRKDIQELSFWRSDDVDEGEFEDEEEEEEWEGRQSPLTFVLVVAVFIVASAIGWFIFRWAMGPSTTTPPLIQANSDPYKVRPENPGGVMIPHQDKLIYGRLSPEGQPQPVERLLPPPEQPMGLQQSPQQIQQVPPYGGQPQQVVPPQQPQNIPYPNGQPGFQPGQGEVPQQQQGAGGYQQQGYTQQQVQQGGQHPSQQAHPQNSPQMPYDGHQQPQVYPQQNSQVYPPVAPQHSGENSTGQSGQLKHEGPMHSPQNRNSQNMAQGLSSNNAPMNQREEGLVQGELDQLIAQEIGEDTQEDFGGMQVLGPKKGTTQPFVSPTSVVEGETRQKKSANKGALEEGDRPLVATKRSVTTGAHKYRVQIASLSSQASADRELKRLKSGSLGAVFTGKKLGIQKIETPGKSTTYRLLAGSFPTREAASQFCRKAKTQGAGCLIVNPSPE